jgi:hypothetical protein
MPARHLEIDRAAVSCLCSLLRRLAQAHMATADDLAQAAYRMFCEAAEIGDRFGDRDLIALARHSRGRVLIRMGEVRTASVCWTRR